jgi:alkylation response protein AidB-like acyl-CoA dehydrogenase
MRFAFTDDQLAFREAVRDLLAVECPPGVVRAAWPGATSGAGARSAPDDVSRVWTALGEMGVLGLAVPEQHGGLGLAELDWVLLAEETGYAALPHPFVETVSVAGPLLARLGDPGARLAGLVAGELTITAQFDDSTLVPFGQSADVFLLRCDDGLHVVGRDEAMCAPMDSVDGSRRLAQLTSEPGGSPLLAHHDGELDRAFDRGALGTAAQLLGLGRRMLDMTVGYVKERHQFGVPVGSFQAIKHHLADVALLLTFAAPAVHRAAYSLATDAPTSGRDVSMAKAMASDAARLAARQSLQCHGAIGYTVEYDLHLFLKRAEALARTWGDAAWHRRRIATGLGI